MARLDTVINVADLPVRDTNYEPLPPGWYDVEIPAAEVRETKDGTGSYIRVRYNVTAFSHAGRVVFGNLNVRNRSAKAEEIGRAQAGELCRAIGIERLEDSDQLIGGRLSIKLDIRPADGQYQAQNEVRGFRALEGAAPAAAPAKKSPPWANRK